MFLRRPIPHSVKQLFGVKTQRQHPQKTNSSLSREKAKPLCVLIVAVWMIQGKPTKRVPLANAIIDWPRTCAKSCHVRNWQEMHNWVVRSVFQNVSETRPTIGSTFSEKFSATSSKRQQSELAKELPHSAPRRRHHCFHFCVAKTNKQNLPGPIYLQIEQTIITSSSNR